MNDGIKITFGRGNEVTKEPAFFGASEGVTLETVIRNATVSGFLGYDADGVDALVNDIPVNRPYTMVVCSGDTIRLVTKASSKA